MIGLGLAIPTVVARAPGLSNNPIGYDVIVLAGQSNMVGRYGPIDGSLDATDPRILQYGFDGQTVTLAANPLDHQDETANTIGLGLTFAKAHLATISSNRKVLLVPCAKGGTAFSTGFWRAGGGGDAPAIARTNAAMAQTLGVGNVNRLVAILWHQGESDNAQTQATYQADLDALIARWRSSMTGASASTPFVCGGLLVGGSQTAAPISAALSGVTSRVSYTGYAPSTSLVSGGDNLHFNAASQRTFGDRYFTAFGQAKTNVVTATVPAAPTVVPTAGSGQVSLAISTASNGGSAVTGYNVYRSTSSGAETLVASNVSSPYVDTGRTNGTTYYYKASAVNAIGESALSSEVSATPVAAPTNLISEVNTFNNWTADGVTVTTDVAANPATGVTNADRITQVANFSAHSLTLTGQGSVVSGQPVTFAVDVKSDGQQYFQLFVSASISNVSPYANFDVINGTVGLTSGMTGSITSLGGGWYRCAATFTATGSNPFAGVARPIVSPTAIRGSGEQVNSGQEKSLLYANAQAVVGSSPNAF